jgi:hypothetical protein
VTEQEMSDTRTYPLPRPPAGQTDARFTLGLALDVAAQLEKHGYPPVRNRLDFVALQQALFRFIYGGPESP